MSSGPDSEQKGNLRDRTKAFAIRIVKLYVALPKSHEAQILGKQLLRSGTSIGAHYREAQRSRSPAEFVSKIELALQELEESDYWIELLLECEILSAGRLADLRQEIQELLAMLTSTAKTIKANRGK